MANKERTEKATERRRKKASDDGQFAYSQQLTSAMTLAVCIPTVFYYLHSPAGFRSFFASILQDVTSSRNPELILGTIIRRTGIYFLMIAAPVFAAAQRPARQSSKNRFPCALLWCPVSTPDCANW